MKLKYDAINDKNANTSENPDPSSQVSRDFFAKIKLKRGFLKISTRKPSEVFIFKNGNSADLSPLTIDQRNRVDLIINALLKSVNKCYAYTGLFRRGKHKQQLLLKAIPAGFLQYRSTQALFQSTAKGKKSKRILEEKNKSLALNIFKTDHTHLKSIYNDSFKPNRLPYYSAKIPSTGKDLYVKIKKTKKAWRKKYKFGYKSAHKTFLKLEDDDKHLVAYAINQKLISIINGTQKISPEELGDFLESIPYDFFIFKELQKSFQTVASDKFKYIFNKKLFAFYKQLKLDGTLYEASEKIKDEDCTIYSSFEEECVHKNLIDNPLERK